MPTAQVDEEGAYVHYEDSGAPAGHSSYLTIVIIHGFLFHSVVFDPVVPYATERDVRLIRMNLRDYPGSKRFSAEELEDFGSGDPSLQSPRMGMLGHQIAMFLVHVATTLDLPEPVSDGHSRTGGIALVGWSFGNTTTLSMLANASTLPQEAKSILDRYLRTVVMYDAPTLTIGMTPPSISYHPFHDMSLTLEERARRFSHWVTWYKEPVADLASVTPELLAARRPMHELYPDPGHPKSPTASRMTTDELDSCVDFGIVKRSWSRQVLVKAEVYQANMRKALFDTSGVLPSVDVLVLWCDMSTTEVLWAAKTLSDMQFTASPDNVTRKVKFSKIPGANHFAHWDLPNEFISILVEELTS